MPAALQSFATVATVPAPLTIFSCPGPFQSSRSLSISVISLCSSPRNIQQEALTGVLARESVLSEAPINRPTYVGGPRTRMINTFCICCMPDKTWPRNIFGVCFLAMRVRLVGCAPLVHPSVFPPSFLHFLFPKLPLSAYSIPHRCLLSTPR